MTEFRVNTTTTGGQAGSAVDMDADGDFVVTWHSVQDGVSYGIYGQRYNANGIAQGTEFKINTFTNFTQTSSSVALDSDGDFIVTWHSENQDGSDYGIYAQRFSSSGIAQGAEFRVNTVVIGQQAAPAAAMDGDGDFVVTWHSNQEAGAFGIYAQRYNSAGVPQGGEFHPATAFRPGQEFLPR